MFEDFLGFKDWVVPGSEVIERWDIRKFKKYPSRDANDEEIMEFVEDAISAERKIAYGLISEGVPKEEALKEACQYPLKGDAPMDAIRAWVGYNDWLQNEKNLKLNP